MNKKSLKQKLINFVLMCKTEKCLKIIVCQKIMCKNNSWKIWTRGGFGNSDAPGQGEGWFENQRFWQTSFVDGP